MRFERKISSRKRFFCSSGFIVSLWNSADRESGISSAGSADDNSSFLRCRGSPRQLPSAAVRNCCRDNPGRWDCIVFSPCLPEWIRTGGFFRTSLILLQSRNHRGEQGSSSAVYFLLRESRGQSQEKIRNRTSRLPIRMKKGKEMNVETIQVRGACIFSARQKTHRMPANWILLLTTLFILWKMLLPSQG